jgi:hypothetical protein
MDLLVRRLFGNRAFWDSAVETVEIHPSQAFDRPGAIFEDELFNITGTAPGAPLARRIEYMTPGLDKLGPTMAHRFGDLRVSQGSIYSRTGHISIRKQKRRAFGKKRHELIDTNVALSCNMASTSVYYHWAIEQLNRELLAKDMGVEAVTLPTITPFWHEGDLRKAAGLHARTIGDAVLRNCWVYLDRPRNQSFSDRFNRLREKTVLPAEDTSDQMIYLRRGQRNAEKREIQNEEAFESFLSDLGFKILDVSSASLEELAKGLSNAKVTCTIEGSQAAHHFLHAPRGAALLILMPSDRFNHILKEMCDILDMRFGFVLGKISGANQYIYPHNKFERVLHRLTA